jgi:hypothetical protein
MVVVRVLLVLLVVVLLLMIGGGTHAHPDDFKLSKEDEEALAKSNAQRPMKPIEVMIKARGAGKRRRSRTTTANARWRRGP